MPQLGFALIGCGGMGRSETRQLVNIPEARLVAACDVNEAAAREFAEEMGVPYYTDYKDVLARPEVGAVIVATPNGLHTGIVVDAANAGKHVFVEKPFAFTVAECDQMIEAAQRNDVKLVVGHVLRLLPLFQRVIDIFDSGMLGRPVSAQITRIGWIGDPKARYRLRKATTGGLLYDITVHEIDLLHRLLGPAESVYALIGSYVQKHIDYEDTLHLAIRYRQGGSATVFEALSATVGGHHGIIIGEKGTLRYQHGAGASITYKTADAGSETVHETVDRTQGENGYLRELRALTEWALYDKEPIISWREGRAAIQVAEAAYQSAATGRPVQIAG